MMEIVIGVAFLIVATICGLLLSPTDAEIQARTFQPRAAPEDHSGHDDRGHAH